MTPYEYADFPILVTLSRAGTGQRTYISYFASQDKVLQRYIEEAVRIPTMIEEVCLSTKSFELMEEYYRANNMIVEE